MNLRKLGRMDFLVGLKKKLTTLPKTNSLHLKINVWKMHFLLGNPIFRCYVSFREGNPILTDLSTTNHTSNLKPYRLRKTTAEPQRLPVAVSVPRFTRLPFESAGHPGRGFNKLDEVRGKPSVGVCPAPSGAVYRVC